jgi:hypothetical protein
MVFNVSVLLVSLDVAVKLTLMNVHLNLVTMVPVVWTYPRDIVASVLLVSYTKIITSLNLLFQVTTGNHSSSSIISVLYWLMYLRFLHYQYTVYFLAISCWKSRQDVGDINNSVEIVLTYI